MKKYYFIIKGKKEGPFSLDEITKLDINKNTLIWCNGLNDWTEFQYVTELSDLFDHIAPPIPEIHKNSAQNIKIETPIDIKILGTNNLSNEELNQKVRKIVKRILKEFGMLILYFVFSSLLSISTYYIFFEFNRPEPVSERNQGLFNEKYYESKDKYGICYNFYDLYCEYIGFYKYDTELEGDDFTHMNQNRIWILKEKSTTLSWYVFFSLISLLILIRYLIAFIKWLNPVKPSNKNQNNTIIKQIINFWFY